MKYFRLLNLLIFLLVVPAAFAADKPLAIGWANLQWPPATNHIISVTNRTPTIYGQVWIDGVTSQPGATPKLIAQLGFGPAGSNPQSNINWNWVDAAYNVDVGNNDEFMASLLPESTGTFDYLYRYSTTGGSNWFYADLKGPVPASQAPANPGKLTVTSSGDTTPPEVPSGFVVSSTSRTEIKLAWRRISDDPTLYGYELFRSDNAGRNYTNIARLSTNSFTDSTIKAGVTYSYTIRSLDKSFNRSAPSTELSVQAEPSVSVTFTVTVPNTTESTGKPVYLAGTLAALNASLPDWNPGGLILNRLDSTHWSITLSGKEGTPINYKYTLGSWDNVEKGGTCDEISDRQLKLTSGPDGTQDVTDTVPNWRNIGPCKD